ncbi:MAG TPA: hypothetical protein VJ001_10975 [Rhodocyclaceae bacterium]|nr:hypothetical protein [Rhodocyclaceae bacterium]
MNQNDIAVHLGLSQSAVSQLMSELGIDWRSADLSTIRLAYIARLREQAAGRLAKGDLDLTTERAGLSRAQRERVELQNAVLRGSLVDVEGVRFAVTNLAAYTRSGFELIADKLSGRLAAIATERECHAVLSTEIEQVLSDLAKGAREMKFLPAADGMTQQAESKEPT